LPDDPQQRQNLLFGVLTKGEKDLEYRANKDIVKVLSQKDGKPVGWITISPWKSVDGSIENRPEWGQFFWLSRFRKAPVAMTQVRAVAVDHDSYPHYYR